MRENLGFSKPVILDALNKSLTRLQTDYVDVYQLHWPERNTNFFGKRNYVHDFDEKWKDNFREVTETLDSLVKEGKIRHYGVSNETSWGLMRHLYESTHNNLTQLSLAFVNQQPFLTSTIIGATSMPQLKENMSSIHVDLSEDILKEIDAIQELQPNPSP